MPLLLAVTGTLQAQGVGRSAGQRGPALNWVRLPGAESCIAPVELAQRVETRLGRAVFVRMNDAVVVIEGRVAPNPPRGFITVIQVSDPDGTLHGTREIELADSDCRKLDEVVALVIAVTIRRPSSGASGIALPPEITLELDRLFDDSSSELDPSTLPPAAPSQDVTRTAVPRVQPLPVVPRSAVVEHPDRLHLDLEAGLALTSGVQPSMTFGPRLGVRLTMDAVATAELSASIGLPRDQRVGGGESGTLEYDVLRAALGLCPPSWRFGRSELSLCAVAQLGRLHVQGRDFQRNLEPVNELWVDLGPEVSVRSMLFAPGYVQLALAAPIRLTIPRFQYKDTQGRSITAFTVARAGVQVEFGVGLRL